MPWPCVQHLSLTVRDVDRARRFYRDFLGFTAIGGGGDDVAELVMGESKLVLLRNANVSPAGEFHFGFKEDTRAAVDEWGAKARATGMRVDFGPAVAEWGGYVLYIRDPDGYQIELWAD